MENSKETTMKASRPLPYHATFLAATLVAVLAGPAFAGECPTHVQKIDEASAETFARSRRNCSKCSAERLRLPRRSPTGDAPVPPAMLDSDPRQ